jgi:hypothetical protein
MGPLENPASARKMLVSIATLTLDIEIASLTEYQ